MTAQPDDAQHRCQRGDWCSNRTVTFEDGQQVIIPALVSPWRPWCDACEEWIGYCLRDLPGYWLRLAAMTGDPLQSDTPVKTPFGPQLPVREDIDAHMRMMASVLAGWEVRIRMVAHYSRRGSRKRCRGKCGKDCRCGVLPVDDPQVVRDTCDMLRNHIRTLLTLDRAPMKRTFSLPLSEEIAAMIADEPSFGTGTGYVSVLLQVGAADAGREILHLHYRCRSLLLETNPPAERLIPPCRRCYHRALSRAWPSGSREVFSRCDRCGDEMTSQEYDVNAKRRLATEQRGRELPVLGEPAAS